MDVFSSMLLHINAQQKMFLKQNSLIWLAFSKLSDKFSPNLQNSPKQAISPNLQISLTNDNVKYIYAKSSYVSLTLVVCWGHARHTPCKAIPEKLQTGVVKVYILFLKKKPGNFQICYFTIGLRLIRNKLSPLRILQNCVTPFWRKFQGQKTNENFT